MNIVGLILRRSLLQAKSLEGCSLAETGALALRDAALRAAPQGEGVDARAKIRAVRRRFVDFVRDEDGSPLVEFTLLAPMLFIVLFAIAEWGNIFYYQNQMFIAARIAVRQVAYGTISNTSAAAIAAACSSPSPLHNSGYTYTFTFTSNSGCPASGYPLTSPAYGTVTLQITTPAASVSIFNYLNAIGATLSASVTMQQEYWCTAASSGSSTSSKSC